LSPDHASAHLGKAGRPRATNIIRSRIPDEEVTPQISDLDKTLTTPPDHR
jgi:hypothetical protein